MVLEDWKEEILQSSGCWETSWMCEINKDEMKPSRVKTLKLDTESRNECKRRREEKKKAVRRAITKQAPSAQGKKQEPGGSWGLGLLLG